MLELNLLENKRIKAEKRDYLNGLYRKDDAAEI